MPDEEFIDEPLMSFEETLAAMRPRAGRLDPAWGAMLAKEVELNALLRWQRPASATEPAPIFGCGHHHCTNASGHWFVCLHCGGELPVGSRVGRWAWPAALSMMTSIAAILLVMLVTQQQGLVAGQNVNAETSRLAASTRPVAGFSGDTADEPIPSRPPAPRHAAGGSIEAGIWPPLVASKQPDGREVLSAGDMQRAVSFRAIGSLLTPN